MPPRPRLSVGTNGTDMQLRMVAPGLVPRTTLAQSPIASKIAIVEPNDFSLQLDVWLAHPTHPGNLRAPVELLVSSITESFVGRLVVVLNTEPTRSRSMGYDRLLAA